MFRSKYVWTQPINRLYYANIQQILEIYNKYMISADQGFNYKSASRVLKEAGIELDEKLAKQQYDLA